MTVLVSFFMLVGVSFGGARLGELLNLDIDPGRVPASRGQSLRRPKPTSSARS